MRAGLARRGLAARHRLIPVIAAAAPDPIAAGYAACERATRHAAANFSLGIRLLPRQRRRALCALYWFFHLADETVDGAAPPAGRRSGLARVRGDLDAALAGAPPDARWAALADAVGRYRVPPSFCAP